MDIMYLHAWAHSTSDAGARSDANCRFLDGLLRLGSVAATPGVTIAVDQTVEQGIPCIRINFLLPHTCPSTGIRSIPVLVPTACVGTGTFPTHYVFNALIEEIISWLAHIGPKHTLVRLYRNNHGQPLAHSHSTSWQQLHGAFASFISSLRASHHHFPGLGQMSGASGIIEVTQARTSSQQASADYIVTLTLGNRQQMSLYLPHSVGQLPREWMFDWLEIQNEFSSQA